jgi:predicted lipoprotein
MKVNMIKNSMVSRKSVLALLVSLSLTSVLTACGGGGGSDGGTVAPTTPAPTTPTSTIDEQFGFWLTDLTNNHILPSYQSLQDKAQALNKDTIDFCALANQNSNGLTQVQDSWRALSSSWQAIQWLKVGPVLDDNRIFRLHYWPDSKDNVGRGVANLLTQDNVVNEEVIAKQSVGSQGLPAMAILLFNETSKTSLLTAEDKEKRCEILQAISANVATISNEINSGWQASQGNYQAQLIQGTGDFSSKKDSVEELVTNWLEQLERVKDEKMLVPLALEAPGIPSIVEQPLSGESLNSIKTNIDTFRVIYTAGDGRGFDDILTDFLEQKNINTEMLAAIDAAIVASQALNGHYENLLKTEDGRANITATIDSLRLVRDVLTADFVQATDINIGFNSNDGD